MKKSIIYLLAFILPVITLAQSPSMFSYQAVVRNSSNQPVVNQTVGMRISILYQKPFGNAIYSEHHSPKTNENGLVSIIIGSGDHPITGYFDSINWADGPYFLLTEIDPAGGSNYTITGSTQLLSVPYALYARTASIADSVRYKPMIEEPKKMHFIGELYGGGIIVSLNTDSLGEQHGLIMSLKYLDQNMTLAKYYTTSANENTSWDGKFNTEQLVQFYGPGEYAAYGCDTFTGGGFSDWYLPSIFELEQALLNGYLYQPVLINHPDAEYLTEKTANPNLLSEIATSTLFTVREYFCYSPYLHRIDAYSVFIQNGNYFQKFRVRPFRRF